VLAVAGTAYVQMHTFSWLALAAAVPVGLLACALLVVNNLRDIGTDLTAGKRTLAVMLGEQRSRILYGACALLPFAAAVAIAPARPLALLTLAAAPLALPPVRLVASGASGRVLITALGQTGRVQLAFGALLAIGLAIRP
jgi:1,4-dihydroxy-2-naphthoate octaprenyltransferase